MLSRHLLLAFVVSLVLHAAVLGAGALKGWTKPAAPQVMQVSLPPPPAELPPAETLIKNTLAPEEAEPQPKPPESKIEPRPQQTPKLRPTRSEKRQAQAAQKKLAEHTYYPPEAIAQGLEGTVSVLVVFTDDGSISDVQLAASSGHPILDRAAVKDAWSIGRFPGITLRQLILDVIYRLE